MKVTIKFPKDGGYPTFKNHVCLFKSKTKVRENAKKAGLLPVNQKQFRKLLNETQAIQHLISCGTWFDTVRY